MGWAVVKWFEDGEEHWGWRYYCSNCEMWHAPNRWHDSEKPTEDFPDYCKNCQTTLNQKFSELEAQNRIGDIDMNRVERVY